MDKYEFNIKLDQIKKLAAKKDYKAAARLANSMDWRKVKDWATLATVINVQEASGYIEEARDTAILAYNRNQGGRRLVYKLTELFIRLGQFDDAEDLYNEYLHMASHDVNRFILEYKLRKAENAQVGTLIEILEEYKEQEIDEKYMFELAQLYSYANLIDKCVRICDEIILWFPDGEFVDSAVRLKQKYSDITSTQQRLFEEAVKKKDSPDEEETKEILFAKAHEEVQYSDEIEDELEEEEKPKAKKLFSLVHKDNNAQDRDYYEEEYEEEFEDGEEDGPSVDLIQNKADEGAKSFFKALLDRVEAVRGQDREVELNESPIPEPVDDETAADDEEALREFVTDEKSDIEKAKQSLNELIAKAKQNIEDSYENVRQQDAEEELTRTAQQIEVPVNDYNIYDTRSLQAELAKNLDEIMQEDAGDGSDGITDTEDTTGITDTAVTTDITGTVKATDAADTENAINTLNTAAGIGAEVSVQSVNTSGSDEAEEDTQIEGQMSIADWVEAVQEKKYGKQETKEFSKAELERELAERESKEEAYDRLMAKQKAYAEQCGVPFNELQARLNARHELFVQSVKTDLAIRTGKAAARMENNAVKQKEDDKIWLFAYKNRAVEEEAAASLEASGSLHQEEYSDNDNSEQLAREVREALEGSAATEEASGSYNDNSTYDEEYDDGGYYDGGEGSNDEYGEYDSEYSDDSDYDDADSYDSDEYGENYDDGNSYEGEYEGEYEDQEYDSQDEDDEYEEETPKNVRSIFKFAKKKAAQKEVEEYNGDDGRQYDEPEYDEEYEPEIPKEVRKFFSRYNDMDGVTEQLAEYFDQVESEIGQLTSSTGNIIISGNRSADKTNLAKNIARALNQLYPKYSRKIAKTTGESINQRGIVKSLPKLMGTVLIIEDAGSIIPRKISELLDVMHQKTDGMLVILIDSDADINLLLGANPDITDTFNHRIIIKQYSIAELVDYARKYAGKRQHVVNDDALTLLYMKINKMNKEKEYIRTDEVKEIIDKAIANAERRVSRRLFGRHVRRGGEYLVLTESDFKD